MAEKLEYPQASFQNALKLAEAIASLGGKSSKEVAVDKIGQKNANSGSFQRLVGAATKYNLIKNVKGELFTSELYKDITLSYNDDETSKNLIKAFLSPVIFRNVYDKLKGQKLPNKELLSKMLKREFNVAENIGSPVAKYFIEGLKQLHLLETDGKIKVLSDVIENSGDTTLSDDPIDAEDQGKDGLAVIKTPNQSESNLELPHIPTSNSYFVHFFGPGMNSRYEIQEEDDIEIVQATLKKIKKKLPANGNN